MEFLFAVSEFSTAGSVYSELEPSRVYAECIIVTEHSINL